MRLNQENPHSASLFTLSLFCIYICLFVPCLFWPANFLFSYFCLDEYHSVTESKQNNDCLLYRVISSAWAYSRNSVRTFRMSRAVKLFTYTQLYIQCCVLSTVYCLCLNVSKCVYTAGALRFVPHILCTHWRSNDTNITFSLHTHLVWQDRTTDVRQKK